MKERLREMEKWWNEVATEDDDDSENDKDSKVFQFFSDFLQEIILFVS